MSISFFHKLWRASPQQKVAAFFVFGLGLLLVAHPALYPRQTVFSIVGGASLAVWAVAMLGAGRRLDFPPSIVWGPAVFLLGSAVLSLVRQAEPGWMSLALLVAQLLCCMAGWWLAADPDALRLTGYGLVGGAAGAATYGVVQFFQLDPLPLATPFKDRVVAVFTNPNHFGSFMALTLPLAVAFYLQRVTRRYLTGVAVVLIYSGLLLSGSRGAWIGGGFGVLVVLVGRGLQGPDGSRAYLWRALVSMGVLLGAVTWGLTYRPIIKNGEKTVTMKERALSAKNMIGTGVAQDSSINHRYFIWQVSWNMVESAPVLGLGYGQYAVHFTAFRNQLTQQGRFASLNPGQQQEITPYAHNEYIHWWTECGILGLLGFLGMIWVGLGRGVGTIWQAKKYTAWAWGGMGLLLAILVHSLVSYPLRLPLNSMPFWLFLGAFYRKTLK